MRRIILLGWRQIILFAVLLTFSGLIARNLVYYQVTAHAYYAREATKIYDSETNVPAQRGGIVDTQWQPLVTNVAAYLIAADPQFVPHPRYAAAKLARALHLDPGRILLRLTTPHTRYVIVARQVDDAAAHAVESLHLQGIIVRSTGRAFFPLGRLASPLLGFVDASGQGQYGLEQRYNSQLTGVDGSQMQYIDTSNRPLPVGVTKPRPPIDGATLVLTIDARIQAVVEQRLAAAIARYGAENGTAIVMDPHTGAIMAMASLPSFDPNNPNQYALSGQWQRFVNQTLQRYQPGSTFKIVSVATGLDVGAFTPQTRVWDPGYYLNYGMTVRNWDLGNGWQWETPEKMLRYSANVGMAQFANMIKPPTTYYDYLTQRFGFGSSTGVGLDESPGLVRTPTNGQPWRMMDLLTNSYGQGIDVTPLQLTDAVASLANGGVRMRPYVVRQIVYPKSALNPRGRTVVIHPHRLGQTVSAATAATMTNMLRTSAYQGEAMCALTKDYPVAAKTGTASIEGPAAHGMDLSQGTVASLIGYAPANSPRFIMLVTLRHPQPGPGMRHIWGSVVAAPVWHDIATHLYRLLDIPAQPGATPPDLAKSQGPTDWGCEFTPGL